MKRIAIIGFGNIAQKHVEVLRALGCTIVASSNRSQEKNLQAQLAGIPKTYTDYNEMIRVEKPDGLVICASFWNMYTILKEVIPYQIPILAEKPAGTSLIEHQELTTLADHYNTSVMIGLNRRHYSVLNRAIEDAGGKAMINAVFIEWSEDPIHLAKNKHLSDELIGKHIFANSIHGLDLLVYLCGEITDVNTLTSTLDGSFQWLMNLNGKSQRGVIFNFNSSWVNHVPWRVVFYAGKKRYVFAPLEKCEVNEVKIKYTIEACEEDKKFKAGFFSQNKIFVNQSKEIENHNLKSAKNAMVLAQSLTMLLLT